MQNVPLKLLGNVFGKMKEMIDFHRLSVLEFLGKGNLINKLQGYLKLKIVYSAKKSTRMAIN